MNWFVFVAGLMYAFGTFYQASHGSYKLAGVYVAYAVANFILATLE